MACEGQRSRVREMIMRRTSRREFSTKLALIAASGFAAALPKVALAVTEDDRPGEFSGDELLQAGHHFFGTLSRGLAQVVEEATRRWGRPNGYILGQEAGGAFIGGLRYGEGLMYTRNAGDLKVFWQGPSLGFDAGADGDRTMMLVYGLPAVRAVFQRFAGVDGSAYFVGGFGMTALAANNVVVVPVRTGVGARLGVNVGYLKFTAQPTWNPF